MVDAPFLRCFGSDNRILVFGRNGKCAILFRRTNQSQNRPGDLRQTALGNIAGGNTQGIHGVGRIEALHISELLRRDVLGGLQAASGQKHIADAVLQHRLEQGFQIFTVQRLKIASSLIVAQCGEIVGDLILRSIFCRRQQSRRQCGGILQITEGVAQGFDDLRLKLLLHLPDGNRHGETGFVGVRNIEVVFQSASSGMFLVEHGDAGGTTIHPPSEPPVPAMLALDGKHGGGIGLLGKQQHLLVKGQLVVPTGCCQKALPRICVRQFFHSPLV